MGFHNAEQLREVFLSCGMGFLLAMGYDLFDGVRRWLCPPRWRVFVGDCLFFSVAAVAVFLFSLAMTGGTVRAYVLLSLPVGAVAYRRTLGKAWRRVRRRVAEKWRQWQGRWRHRLGELRAKIGEALRTGAKKIELFFKKGLQPVREIMYNHKV